MLFVLCWFWGRSGVWVREMGIEENEGKLRSKGNKKNKEVQ